MKKSMMVAALAASAALAACGGADGDVAKVMTAYYEKPLCANFVPQPPFTIFTQSITGGDMVAPVAQVLTEAGILAKTGEQVLGGGNVTATFDATKMGAEIIEGNRICYGKSKVAKFLDVGLAEHAMGQEVRTVRVLVSYEITEDWAKDPALAYLVMSGEHEMTHVLMKEGDAWVVAY